MSTERAWERIGESVVTAYAASEAHPPMSSTASYGVIGDAVKRLFDVCAAIIGLILISPVLLALAIMIRLDSPGPILFSDQRLGKGGRPFKCHKFRTMHTNGAELLDRYLADNPVAAEEWAVYKKLRTHDPRVSNIGTLLRKLSLDELPQLWNVVIGEMSLVGPRPYLLREYDEMGMRAGEILAVRPGITGLWQVGGRNDLSFKQRLRLEGWYVRHRSLFFDFSLLLKTVAVVLGKRGAY